MAKKTAGQDPASSAAPKRAARPRRAGGRAPAPASPEARGASASGAPSQADDGSRGAGIPTHEQIAEAAYHRFLQRGATHGRDFDDWIEAERELRTRR